MLTLGRICKKPKPSLMVFTRHINSDMQYSDMNQKESQERASARQLRLDDQLCFALYAATNAVTRTYRPLLAKIGITYPQYLVMLVLWQHGPNSVGDVGKRLHLAASAITPLVDQLERAGMVARARGTADRRVVQVRLTDKGRELERSAALAQHEVACRTGLEDDEFNAMRESLHALVDRMAPDLELDVEEEH